MHFLFVSLVIFPFLVQSVCGGGVAVLLFWTRLPLYSSLFPSILHLVFGLGRSDDLQSFPHGLYSSSEYTGEGGTKMGRRFWSGPSWNLGGRWAGVAFERIAYSPMLDWYMVPPEFDVVLLFVVGLLVVSWSDAVAWQL